MLFYVKKLGFFPDFKLLWLMDETKKNLPMELDFLHEAHNADMLRNLMTHCKWLKIPKVYWNYSTERVLVMEYMDGGQINDLGYLQKEKISPREVTQKVGTLYSEMIFSHGFVHCDPHPGNLLVNKNKVNGETQIVLLDHGLYTVSESE
jgi:aarF domain-containing kinase